MKLASTLLALLTGLVALHGPAYAQSRQPVTAERAAIETGRPAATSVRNFVFIARQASGWRQYTVRHAPLFKAGEALQFYAEPVNLGWSGGGQSYRFDMRVDLEIRTPEGQVVWGQKDYGHLSHTSPSVDPNTYVTGSVTVKGLPPGLYVLNVRFRDTRNNRSAETEMTFGITPEPRTVDA
jgi:hypothetical protein